MCETYGNTKCTRAGTNAVNFATFFVNDTRMCEINPMISWQIIPCKHDMEILPGISAIGETYTINQDRGKINING